MFTLDTEASGIGSDNQVYSVAPMGYSVAHVGQLAAPAMWHLASDVAGGARISEAWRYSLGTGVTISIVDEGVNYRHADLAWSYDAKIDYDPRDLDEADAMIDVATQRHGTNVAGLVAGDMANDFGTVGGSQGSSFTATFLRYGDDFRLSELADIVGHQSNYDVSNNSWGFTSPFADNFMSANFAPTAAAFADGVAEGRDGLGTVFVFAAGNGKFVQNAINIGDDAGFHNLTNSRFTIAVGAHDADGNVAFFSNPGASVLLTAPGMSVRTTNGATAYATTGSYVSGTSFAAPLVSSTVALMLAANPDLGYRDVHEILALSAQSRVDGSSAANGATNFNGGGLMFGRDGGFGLLDAAAAVNLARYWDRQSTAANEQRLDATFGTPVAPDKTHAVLETEIVSPDGRGFAIDRVELELDLFDKGLKDLTISLVSPDGSRTLIAESMASVGSRTSLKFEFGSVANWGEDPFGTWKIELTHSREPTTFIAFDAKLRVYGDYDLADDTHYVTGSFSALVALDADRAVLRDDDGGIDTLNFIAARSPVTVDLSGETASSIDGTGFVLADPFENVVGTVFGDRIVGSDVDNRLVGDDGDDVLVGRAGADWLEGGLGDDVLDAGAGADTVVGGEGRDTLMLVGSISDYTITRDGTTYHIVDAAGDLDEVDGIELISFDDTVVDLTLDPDAVVAGACRIEEIAAEEVISVGASTTVTQVAVVTACDPNLAAGDLLRFSLVGPDGGAYTGPFEVVAVAPGTAIVRLLGSVTGDFDLSVRVTDSMGHSDTQGLSVSVVRSNAAPISIAIDGSSVLEEEAGALVGLLAGVDPDGDALAFAVDDARFEIVGTDLGYVLKLKDGVSLDHETMSDVAVTVTATDAGGLFLTRTFEVSIADLNEAPTGKAVSVAVVEQGSYQAALDIRPFLDPEGDTITYTVSGLAVGGRVQLRDGTIVVLGDVLTEVDLVSLVYTADEDAQSGLLSFIASDGDRVQDLTVVTEVTNAIAGTHRGGDAADRLDGAGGDDLVRGLRGNDTIYGGSGSDTLDGGAGVDWLGGGSGDDVYVVGQFGDVVCEVAGGGGDTVIATFNYALGAGQEIETLRLSPATGSSAFKLTGNEFANKLIGNAGNNVLIAGEGSDTLIGGAGADTMIGGTGDDIYWLDHSGDVAREAAGGGDDVVISTISYALGAGHEVETLRLANITGASDIDLTGNGFANTLIGNDGDNVLDGRGGADVLRGYAGDDTFVFSTRMDGTNIDRIVDFGLGDDTIQLSRAVFAKLSLGDLSADAFKDVTPGRGGALDVTDRLLYNRATGALSYDADGSGAGAAIQFATLANRPLGLSHEDFFVAS